MSLQVLQAEEQVAAARHTMRSRAASALDEPIDRWRRRLRLLRTVKVGDVQKSWDVLLALEQIERRLKKDEPILDIGCFASEVLISLHKLGFHDLTGVDLNPRLSAMPLSTRIRYQVGDFMRTPFQDSSFLAITSISVIEHGYRPRELLTEVSRLLMPGGIFFASFDYWPDKIDTSATKFFDMSWIIFSRQDVDELLAVAAEYGLRPLGELAYSARDRVIDCAGHQYTFAALALTKAS